MPLNIGIIGLPNVGKSTVFNALTKTQNAEVANYPFCTIKPNKAIVPVPDFRLDKLHELVGAPEKIYTTIEFIDIAGLVSGASQGEGLGNQFLGNIRDAEALVHVVRCFDDPNVVHVSAAPDPRTDIEIINTELILADLEQLERKIERLERQIKGDKKIRPFLDLSRLLKEMLESGQPVSVYPNQEDDTFTRLNHEMRFLTGKPVIYAANVDEDSLQNGNLFTEKLLAVANEQETAVITLCARLEEELVSLSEEERIEYLELAGSHENGLDQLIRTAYKLLNLISFFTFNQNEVRAWTVRNGAAAPEAAGVIHTDFERGFIRAEALEYEAFVRYGSWQAAKTAGALRVEGREYIVQDGDVIYFRFNV